MNITGQPIHQKDTKHRTKRNDGVDRVRLAAVAAMPCCICEEFGLQQMSRTRVHHCMDGRYGTRRSPDCMTIPLCGGHHKREDDDFSKIPFHLERRSWNEKYGKDTDWISWTEQRL